MKVVWGWLSQPFEQMGKRRRKRTQNTPDHVHEHMSGMARDQLAALQLSRELQRNEKDVKAMFVEIGDQHFVVIVRRAEVIITDPASQN